jgi:hypothetical protein
VLLGGAGGVRVLAATTRDTFVPVVDLMFDDGYLMRGDTELAQIAVDVDGLQLVTSERRYAMARSKSHGWHWRVLDPLSGSLVCEFRPLWVRRGGRIQSSEGTVSLTTRLLKTRVWRFTTPEGHRIDGRAEVARRREGGMTILRSGEPPIVTLRIEDSINVIPDPMVTLTLGCWLIVQYECVGYLGAPGSGM